MVMQDPAVTIKSLLSANWNDANVSARLSSSNLDFSTGKPYGLQEDRYAETYGPVAIDKNGSIEVFRVSGIVEPLGLNQGLSICRENYQINIWVRANSGDDADIGNAKIDRWQAEREVSRIIRANRAAMTDLKFGFPKRFVARDEIDREPPILSSFTEVEVVYFET